MVTSLRGKVYQYIVFLLFSFLFALFFVPMAVFADEEIDNASFEEWGNQITSFGQGSIPEDWSILSISSCCDPGPLIPSRVIHQSENAQDGDFSLRLGGDFFAGEDGAFLGVLMYQDIEIYGGEVFDFSYSAFGLNPFGSLAARAWVQWLDENKNPIGVGLFNPLPSSGVGVYTLFSGTTTPAPCNAEFARIRLDKASFGFAHFDNLIFEENESIEEVECD